jgi:hypothetical protein
LDAELELFGRVHSLVVLSQVLTHISQERGSIMSREPTRRFRLLLAVVVMIGVSLACSESDEIEESIDEIIYETPDPENRSQFFEEIAAEGERPYSIEASDQSTLQERGEPANLREECIPEYAQGENVPASIVYSSGNDSVTITDAYGARQYRRTEEDYPFMFCRQVTEEGFSGEECIDFATTSRYLLRRIDSNREYCYYAQFSVSPVGATAAQTPQDDEGDETSGDTDGDPDATTAVDSSGGTGGTAYFEECLAPSDTFVWEIGLPEREEGTGVTACRWSFFVRNTGEQDQHLVIYETSSTGSEGMQWEGWRVTHFGAQDTKEVLCSYVDYYDRGGDITWSYPTMLLVLRQVPECFGFSNSNNPDNVSLWEQHATPLENPCTP